MTDRTILTERREELLSGEYDPDDSADRMAKSRLNNSTETALTELAQIAASPHIENRDALPPELLGELIESAVAPTVEPEDYDEYRRDLYYHVRRSLDMMDTLNGD